MEVNKRLSQIIIFALSILLAIFLLGNDFYEFISWWLCLLVLGLVFLPITSKIFHFFADNGYLFSKVIAIALSGYLMWLLSSFKVLKFKAYSCIIIIFMFFILNYILAKTTSIKGLLRKKIDTYFTGEIVFFIILLFAVYIRGFKPEAYGTEKFMDYGFMTSMMRADYMPAEDFWFAGAGLNYYYVGQFFATFLSKLSFVPVTHAYNLMLMTLATFSILLPSSLVYNISKDLFVKKNIKVRYGPHIAGLISGAAISMAGNMHFTVFYYIIPNIQEILGLERNSYWFSDSTRYIGYYPETEDKTIHEFPSYSFILGDLHAHVLNIIFVLVLIGILYAWLGDSRKIPLNKYKNKKFTVFLKDHIQVKTLFIGFFIGLFHMTNFWDFPIYFVVAGGTILFSLIRNYGFSKITFLLTSINGIIIIIVAELVALPFIISFDQISSNIIRTSSHTPLYQLLILWGLPIAVVVGFVVDLVGSYRIIKGSRQFPVASPKEGKPLIVEKIKNIFKVNIVNFFRIMSLPDLFVLILGLCAIGLVFIPEFIYVEDIYSSSYKRANTMFKLTYQAFIMFGISSGYIFIKLFKNKKPLRQKKFIVICFLLFLSTLGYFPLGINSWYGDISKTENYKGLDASAFLQENMEADYKAIKWINENIQEPSVILEANGDSYSDYQRVSVFTGHSTVLGWYVHEWLWRGDLNLIYERVEDIHTIYTSKNMEEVNELINKYDIDYIYVGNLERDKYGHIDYEFLTSLGHVVYEDYSSDPSLSRSYIISLD